MSQVHTYAASVTVAMLVASTSVVAFSAHAQDYVITTGSDKGTYFNEFGPRIQTLLEQRRFPHEVVTSSGTGENFQRVCDNPHNVAPGQADVLPALIEANPQCPPIRVVNEIASECVFGATAVDDLVNIDQVTEISFNMRIAIPGGGSGSWLTWENMVSQIPLLDDAQVIEVADPVEAVAMVENGDADMMMFVAFPDPNNDVFAAVNGADLSFIDMSNFDLLQQQIGDTYMYDRIEVTVANAGLTFWKGSSTVQTACTKAVVFTGDPSIENLPRGERFQSALVDLLESADPADLRPDEGWLTSIMNSVSNTSRQAMLDAADAAKSFAEDNNINL